MLRLLINMDKSRDRFDKVSSRLAYLGINFKRISAIDGNELTDDFLGKITLPKNDKRKIGCPRDLLRGEIGCYLSHLKCWEELLRSDEKFALILEDDIDISYRAKLFMQSEEWIPSGCQFVQLHGDVIHKAKVKSKILNIGQEGELVELVRPTPVCMWAYVISREVAQYLVNNSRYILAPVDEFIASPYFTFRKKYDIWRLNPCVVTTNGDITTIGSRKIKYRTDILTKVKRRLIKSIYKFNMLDCIEMDLYYK